LNAEILSAGFYHGGGTFCPPALANNFWGQLLGSTPYPVVGGVSQLKFLNLGVSFTLNLLWFEC